MFKKKNGKCSISQQQSEIIYVGSFYSKKEVNNICPWCIKDGSAARKYNGTFHDRYSVEKHFEAVEDLDELIHRTPGYKGWQQEYWLSHCGDFCGFLGYVEWEEISDFQDELKKDIEQLIEKMGLDPAEFRKSLH